jgi:hypothetical protein
MGIGARRPLGMLGIEDNTGWEYSLAFAEMIAALDLK